MVPSSSPTKFKCFFDYTPEQLKITIKNLVSRPLQMPVQVTFVENEYKDNKRHSIKTMTMCPDVQGVMLIKLNKDIDLRSCRVTANETVEFFFPVERLIREA